MAGFLLTYFRKAPIFQKNRELRMAYSKELIKTAAFIVLRSQDVHGFSAARLFGGWDGTNEGTTRFPFEHRVVYQFMMAAQSRVVVGISNPETLPHRYVGEKTAESVAYAPVVPEKMLRAFPDHPEAKQMAVDLFENSLLRVANRVSKKLNESFELAGMGVLPQESIVPYLAHEFRYRGLGNIYTLISDVLSSRFTSEEVGQGDQYQGHMFLRERRAPR